MKFIDNLKYIEAPEALEALEALALKRGERSVFLAGGISGCPDWQSSMVEKLREKGGHLTVFNPRRANFDVTDPTAAEKQITWEFQALRAATIRSFWFEADQIQPIVLFELGAHLDRLVDYVADDIFIGCHPNYPRRQDVVIQTRLARPDITVVDNLDALASLVHARLTS